MVQVQGHRLNEISQFHYCQVQDITIPPISPGAPARQNKDEGLATAD